MSQYAVRKNRIEPLWDRVDRNRVGLAVLLTLFFFSLALCVAAVLFVTWVLVYGVLWVRWLEMGTPISELGGLKAAFPWTFAAGGVAALAYMLWALARDERWFARRLTATLVSTGELLPVKYALKDMAIASGFEVAPALHLIETPNVNAFIFARGRRRAIVGVTRGLVERLETDEQRAVFANLMARLKAGDMLWAGAVTALMSPLWFLYERPLGDAEGMGFESYIDPETGRSGTRPVGIESAILVPQIGIPLFALAGLFVIVSELLAFGHRRSQLRHAEVADAEGMLMLKDPRSMLSALEKTVRFNNYVPTAGPGMTQLFYAWTGDLSTDDESDPENRRVTRLREVLGVEGMAPVRVVENEATFPVAPPAPRLEDGGRSD